MGIGIEGGITVGMPGVTTLTGGGATVGSVAVGGAAEAAGGVEGAFGFARGGSGD